MSRDVWSAASSDAKADQCDRLLFTSVAAARGVAVQATLAWRAAQSGWLADEEAKPQTQARDDDASRRYGDPSSPANLLGENHLFACGEALRRDLRRQSGVTAVAVLVGAVATASGYDLGLPFLISALLVQVGVAVALALHAGVQCERARELIIDGYGDLPLRGLRRERLRLQSAETREVLADTLEALVSAAERWPVLAPAPPTSDPRQIRAVAPRLQALAAALRAREGSLCAVARVDRMLVSGDSPLNGGTLDQLSAELGRIELELRGARRDVAAR